MKPWQAALIAALLVAAVLFGSALIIRSSVREASELTALGMGEALAVAGEEAFSSDAWPPDSALLQEFLDARSEDGLRYVGILTPDGTVLASAGEPLGASLEQGVLQQIDGRARVVHRLRRPRERSAGFRPLPRPSEERDEEGRRRRPRLPLVVYEFEPIVARALQAQSQQLLIVATIASLGILGLAIALARGLSQRERLLEELERGKRLAALGSMSAVLAHELRNPLASLKGHAQLLAESVEEDTRLSPKAGRVVSEAVRLEKLLNDLLTFVKSGELHKAPTDPNEVLRAAVQAAGEAEIDLTLLEGHRKWSLDPARMQQTLENILRNARQASPAGTRLEARVEAGRGQLVFTVRDRGPGIAPGEEERIFEPFVTGRIQGVGLGLAITRRIVELHGGTVTARTHPDGGAEFRITLPGEES